MSGPRGVEPLATHAHPALIDAVHDPRVQLGWETGFPETDAAAAFARERRRQSLATLASRLTMHKREYALAMLPFDDVVAALGRVAEHDLGLREIALESIVGTVSRRSGEFDRLFRPRTRRLQGRWQRIAAARRRGEPMPRSTSTASAICTSFRMAITVCRWHALTATQRSTPASARYRRESPRPTSWCRTSDG
jgi:hypothetical protein